MESVENGMAFHALLRIPGLVLVLNFPFHFKANQLDFMFEMMRTEFPRARVHSPPHGKRLFPGNSKCDDQRVKHNIRLYKLPFF